MEFKFKVSNEEKARQAKDILYIAKGMLASFDIPAQAIESARRNVEAYDDENIIGEIPYEVIELKLKLGAMVTILRREVEDFGGMDSISKEIDPATMIQIDYLRCLKVMLDEIFWYTTRCVIPQTNRKFADTSGVGIRRKDDTWVLVDLEKESPPDILGGILGKLRE